MSAEFIGFEPQRIAALARSTAAAIDRLDALASGDPAAIDALTTLRTISHTLATTWMPLLARLGADPTMRVWTTSGDLTVMPSLRRHGVIARARSTTSRTAQTPPDEAADAMVAACAELLAGDTAPGDTMYRLEALLIQYGADEVVMHDLMCVLGVDRFADVLMILGTLEPSDDALDTAALLRDGLGFVGPADGYGAESMAQVLTDRMDGVGIPTGTDPSSMVDFVMESEYRPAGVEVVLTGLMVEREQRWADDGNGDGDHLYPTPWYLGSTGSNLSVRTTGASWSIDPMSAALSDLARDPDQARMVFADTEMARYLISDRAYDDGYTGMMAFAEAACAGPDVTDPDHPPPPKLTHQTNVFATQAVNWLGQRESFDPTDVSDAASTSAANIEVAHVLAAQMAILRTPRDAEPTAEFLSDPQLSWVHDESLGSDVAVEVATFGIDGVDRLTIMAAESDEGTLVLRAGVNGYQDRRAAGTARVMAAQTSMADAQTRLDQALVESGHIEGYFVGTIGRHLEGRAATEDARASFWITTAGTAATFVARTFPPLAIFASGIPPVQGMLRDSLASSQDAVAASMEQQADDAGDAVLYRFTGALVDAGFIELPDSWPGGSLPSWNEFQQLDLDLIDDLWNGASDPTSAGIVVGLNEVQDAVKLEQLDAYTRLD